jgi:hypothetical protein
VWLGCVDFSDFFLGGCLSPEQSAAGTISRRIVPDTLFAAGVKILMPSSIFSAEHPLA